MEATLSTHKVEIVPVHLEKHPSADSLSLVKVFGGGYTVCVRTEDWKDKTIGAYIPPDSVCPDTPEFEFLGSKKRVKAKKLRGIVSFGLLMPAPEGSKIGDDVAEQMQITHYEPPIRSMFQGSHLYLGGEVTSGPKIFTPRYDVDAFRRYANEVFIEDEPLWITEKIHGASARYVCMDGCMFCGSRGEWKKEYPDYSHLTVENVYNQLVVASARKGSVDLPDCNRRATEIVEKLLSRKSEKNLWWKVLERTPLLESFCCHNPGIVVYGEVFGAVQDLRYGHKNDEVSFAVFDLLKDGWWIDAEKARFTTGANLPWVPLLRIGEPYNFEGVCKFADGPSLWSGADHIREGCVVKPIVERTHPKIGRAQLKIVSSDYLERA
jgi:RNA ligase (TIGR02306 family)